MTLRERLLSRLIIDSESGCLLWSGALAGKGYGTVSVDGRDRYVHRLMYEMFVGPIPEGLEIDHLCRVPRCASPAHLEAVTRSVNVLRGLLPQVMRDRGKSNGTHCLRGHLYDDSNTRMYRGYRWCRSCERERSERRRRKRATG